MKNNLVIPAALGFDSQTWKFYFVIAKTDRNEKQSYSTEYLVFRVFKYSCDYTCSTRFIKVRSQQVFINRVQVTLRFLIMELADLLYKFTTYYLKSREQTSTLLMEYEQKVANYDTKLDVDYTIRLKLGSQPDEFVRLIQKK